MKQSRILVVEDETDILELLEHNLKREGYRVVTASDGKRGLELARRGAPDLVLLDLMLPEMDGIEVCRRLKEDALTRDVPVIMLTAKGEESDVVLGLGVGADDYVAKPFSPREVVARVKAVLRRGPVRAEGESPERRSFAGVIIDSAQHRVFIDDEPAEFTATEFRLLDLLTSKPGRVFSRDQLLSRVIKGDAIVVDRNIDVHVRAVRKKLGPYRDLIETVRGVGYRFQDATK